MMKTLQGAGKRINRQRRSPGLLLAIAALLGTVSATSAQPPSHRAPSSTPIELLTKAVRAPASLNYRAMETLIIQHRGRTHRQRVRVVHRAPDDTRLEYLSGRGEARHIVGDDGRSHWEYLPRRRQIIFSASLPDARELWKARHLTGLTKNYVVSLRGQSVMDGRKAHLLVISPRDGHRGPAKRVWVDETTHLILKSELTSSDGKAKLTSALSDIRFEKTIASREFAPPASAKKQTVIYEQVAVLPLRALARQWKYPLMTPRYMPSGYWLDSARLLGRRGHTFVHLRYFDGVNALSLFESPSPKARDSISPRRPGGRKHEAAVAWKFHPPFWSLTWRAGVVKLTLVGDLPRADLLRVSEGVTRFSR